MRRLAIAAAVLWVAACANLGQPPGGPLRTEPPIVTATSPDSGAVNVREDRVVFHFDAIVQDRDVENLVLISPRDGTPRVRWRRNRIEVRPRDDFRENTAYAVTLLPGITDLNNNAIRTAKTVIFSTGPVIPGLNILGRAFDWIAARPAGGALIEAMRLPDSIPYVGVADSSGQFSIGPLDDATYVLRAMMDNNRNRAIDAGEPWDSALVVVRGVSPVVELLAAPRDTAPPRLLMVTPSDSVTLVASFDRPLDPAQTFAGLFRLQRQDSTTIRVVAAFTRAQLDSAARVVPADTTRPTDPRVAALEERTSATVPLRPSRPSPPQDLTLRLDSLTPMQSGASYRLTAAGVRGLGGQVRTSDRVFQWTARDTVRGPADPPRNAPPVRPP